MRLARFLLTDPQHSSLSIPEVAKRAGFLSTETFRRSIVREFGTTRLIPIGGVGVGV